MKEYYCDYCKQTFNFQKYQQFAAHKLHCKSNPNYQNRIDKMRKTKILPRIEYVFSCKRCDNQYKVIMTQNDFKKGKYKKYCSRSCANVRNHSKETKQKISNSINKYFQDNNKSKKYKNTKKEKREKKKYYCKSCGVLLNNKRKYCKQCSPFTQNVSLFEKLNISNDNLKIASKEAFDILKQQYFDNKQSLSKIKDKYGIMYNTVYNFFKKFNINLRNNKESSLLCWKNGQLNGNNAMNGFNSQCHKTWNNNQVFLRSSYQIKVAQFLDDQKIEYQVQKIKLQYKYKENYHTYISDFYLPKSNLIIQTKCGYFIKKDKKLNDKIKSVKQNGYKFLLIDDYCIENDYKQKIKNIVKV